MRIGYDDNYTDKSFLEEMVMNANVVRRDLLKVMKDSVSISQYLCIVALAVLVWIHTLESSLDENSLLLLDLSLLASGFVILLLSEEKMLSLSLLWRYILNISFFTTGLYTLAPIYQTRDQSAQIRYGQSQFPFSCFTSSCMITLAQPLELQTRMPPWLPSRLHVFAVMLFSLQVFLFAPLVTYYIKKFSYGLHLLFSFPLMGLTLYSIYALPRLFFLVFLFRVLLVNVVCPSWLIKMQQYKFAINGPWDEATLYFDITY